MSEKWNEFKEKWGRPILTSLIASVFFALVGGGIGYTNGKKAGEKSGENAAMNQYYDELLKIKEAHDKKVDEEAKKKSCEEKYDKETKAARNAGILIGQKQGKKEGYDNGMLECKKLLTEQEQAIKKAEAKQKKAEERFSSYLEFFGMYKNNAEELEKMSKELLAKPNAAKQEELNSKFKGLVLSVSAESESAGIFQEVLNGVLQECAKKLELKNAEAINHCLITLAETLPYKEKILTSKIYTMREIIPPEPMKQGNKGNIDAQSGEHETAQGFDRSKK